MKLVGRGLNQQRFAIALPKGAASLKAEIDRVLTELSNEGVVDQLAKQYLNLEPEQSCPRRPQPPNRQRPARPWQPPRRVRRRPVQMPWPLYNT